MSIQPLKFEVFLHEGFSMLAFSSVIGVLNTANRVLGDGSYAWKLVSARGKAVASDSNISIDTDVSLQEDRVP